MAWISRCFFLLVAAVAIGGIVSGTACTRRGMGSSVLPSGSPSASGIWVNPRFGNDSTGNGSQAKPYRTLTKALSTVPTPKPSTSPSGTPVPINLEPGHYSAASGEKFPIVVNANVSLNGSRFGRGPGIGTFIDGYGEDTVFEALAKPKQHAYATIVVPPTAPTIAITSVYVGSQRLQVAGTYASLDAIGTVSGTTAAFGTKVPASASVVTSGILVPSGSLSCDSCEIGAREAAAGLTALTILVSGSSSGKGSGSGSGSGSSFVIPTVTLDHSTAAGDATIVAKQVGIVTDGTANLNVSGVFFEGGAYAYEDALVPVIHGVPAGVVDFGGGPSGSFGLNVLQKATTSELQVTAANETVYAFDDTWNANVQGTDGFGHFKSEHVFGPPPPAVVGQNVSIAKTATSSSVLAGPALPPTPSPSPTASGYYTPSPSPTASST